jgi:hypothetical protein
MNTTRLLTKMCAAAALTVALPASSFAATADFGTISPGDTKGVVLSHTPGSFVDTISFVISLAGSGTADYFNFFVKTSKAIRTNIDMAKLKLTGPTTYTTNLTSEATYSVPLLAGSYTAEITGVANGVNGGSYNFDVTAPTPEPEVFGLMAAGVAMAGFMAKRRRKAVAAA